MTAITINDLNNAKLDVDHIAEVATSHSLTATDRTGNTKSTMYGAVDSLKAYNIRGVWVALSMYAIKDVVSNGGGWYICVSAHVGGAVFAADFANWRIFQGEIFTPSGAGVIPRTAQDKMLESVSTSDYASFADALTSASCKTLLVNSAVSIVGDTTIPSTVNIQVNKSGSFVITTAKTLTINGEFDSNVNACFSGAGEVVFGQGSVPQVFASWFGTTSVAIQKAVNACAVNIKRVYLAPRNFWTISSQIQFPVDSDKWGIEISGCKSEAGYDWLSGAFSTILTVDTAIPSVFTGRTGITATLANYGKIKNIAINGSNLADYGYINGGQDSVSDCTIFDCKKSGVYLGTYTNSSSFVDVTMIANHESGAVLDGDFSTVSTWVRCKFRGNVNAGVTIYSAIGAHFIDCIFENNIGPGTTIYRGANTANIQVLNVKFSKCYWEQNSPIGGYQILIDSVSGAAPGQIQFSEPHINSGAAGKLGVLITRGNNIKFETPLFTGNNTKAAGWFSAGALSAEIEINGLTDVYTDPSTMTIDGSGAGDIRINGLKTIGAKGTFSTMPIQASVIKRQVNTPTARTLLPKEVCGTVITNYGQGAGGQINYLPQAEAGMSFVAVVQTANAAYWALDSANGAVIRLNGTAYTYLSNSPAVVGAAIRFTAVIGAAYGWIAEPISGTWTGA